jgi:hypothetical protein
MDKDQYISREGGGEIIYMLHSKRERYLEKRGPMPRTSPEIEKNTSMRKTDIIDKLACSKSTAQQRLEEGVEQGFIAVAQTKDAGKYYYLWETEWSEKQLAVCAELGKNGRNINKSYIDAAGGLSAVKTDDVDWNSKT